MRVASSQRLLAPVVASAMLLPFYGCGSSKPIALPTAPEQPGTAVVILVDTSGSMEQTVAGAGGQQQAKHLLAKAALDRIIDNTARWKKDHPLQSLDLSIYAFSSDVSPVLSRGEFDEQRAKAAVARIPKPNTNTAIGRALAEGYRDLYASGRKRKFIVCITDGQNTSGPTPDSVAEDLYKQTKGAVELHFVAFDTSAKHFRFLKDVNGHVVEAADGPQLEKQLATIYEKRILAEAEEPAPAK